MLGQLWPPQARKRKPARAATSSRSAAARPHITQALAQSKYPATAPDAKGAIGITADGQVQGVDIDAPTYAWSETHYLPVGVVTPAYKAALYAIAAAPVNNATWRGFAAGEVKFKGASGQQRGEEDWAVTFKFEASPNATGLTVGDITGISQEGLGVSHGPVRRRGTGHAEEDRAETGGRVRQPGLRREQLRGPGDR